MKYFLFLLLLFVFISCDNDPVSEIGKSCEVEKYVNKCDGDKRIFCDNNKVSAEDCQGSCVDGACCKNKDKKVATSYKDNKCFYKCEDDYKACIKQADNTYSCSNIDSSADFKCLKKDDVSTCLNGKPCRLPDKNSEIYKDLEKDAFEAYIENSIEVTCLYNIKETDGQLNDMSSCTYACKKRYEDCDGDLNQLTDSNPESKPNGCEADLDRLHQNSCETCSLNYCNLDKSMLGCETQIEDENGKENNIITKLHLNRCNDCKRGYCNLDGIIDKNSKNGCEVKLSEHPELNLNDCEECKDGYENNDSDWATGCVLSTHLTNPNACGSSSDNTQDCGKDLDSIYLPTCKNGICGKTCNKAVAKICNGQCCANDLVCRSAGGCGCKYGTTRGDCKTEKNNGWDIGYIETCDYSSGEYVKKSCPNLATCNGNVCGQCLDKSLRCKDQWTIQQCQNDKWVTVGDDCVDCYIATCPRDHSYD